MHLVIRRISLGLFVLLCAVSAAAFQKRSQVPIRVEYVSESPAQAGDEVTTVLTFRALADIDRLDVSVSPFKGVEVISQPTERAFTGVKKDDGLEFTVTVRVTDAKLASLGVVYSTQQGNTKRTGATTVEYGQQD